MPTKWRNEDKYIVNRLWSTGLFWQTTACQGRCEQWGAWGHLRCTCSCTWAAPSSGRCGCASPAAAGGCSGPRWEGAAGSAPWTSGQSSHRRPAGRESSLFSILAFETYIDTALIYGSSECSLSSFNESRLKDKIQRNKSGVSNQWQSCCKSIQI